MADTRAGGTMELVAPDKPMSLDAVAELYPRIRQSWLAQHDDCALSSYFEMRYDGPWSSHPQACGTMFHRVAAECLRTMQLQDSEEIPEGVALAILEEALAQRGIPHHERVRIPQRDIPLLRFTVAKFARDNSFSIRRLVGVEVRLDSIIRYVDADGVVRDRTITGQLDALLGGAKEDEAIVIDWKNTWARPPEEDGKDSDDARRVSYHGYFQQKVYGWLVMQNFPQINAVTLREFYPRRKEARSITFKREKLEQAERDLSDLVMDFDLCVASGKPRKLKFPHVAPWNPSPGYHCSYCPAAHRCPIEVEAREKLAITSETRARQAVAELEVAEAVRKQRRDALRPYVELHGPVASKRSKGRRVFGMVNNKSGRGAQLKFFTPEGADRPPRREQGDKAFEDALRRSAEALKRGEEVPERSSPEELVRRGIELMDAFREDNGAESE